MPEIFKFLSENPSYLKDGAYAIGFLFIFAVGVKASHDHIRNESQNHDRFVKKIQAGLRASGQILENRVKSNSHNRDINVN